MVVLLVAAFFGGSTSFAVLWPYGALAALLGAQFGATLLALTAGLLLALLRVKAEPKQSAVFGLHCVLANLASRRFAFSTPVASKKLRSF